MKNKLILASASPQRKILLEDLNIVPDAIMPADINETPHKKELPRPYVKRMAIEKAREISKSNQDAYILAADTVVVMGRRILQKPVDAAEEYEFLSLMSGRRHTVMTGHCLITPKGKEVSKVVETIVKFKRLSEEEKQSYIDSGEWKGKGGGYGIQGQASHYISFISGSYTSVIGLSVFDTVQMLKGNGFQLA